MCATCKVLLAITATVVILVASHAILIPAFDVYTGYEVAEAARPAQIAHDMAGYLSGFLAGVATVAILMIGEKSEKG